MKNNAPKTLTAFMDAIQPDCHWTLTAIEADGPGIETMWFSRDADPASGHHITDLQDWVDRKQSRGFNLYFQPNPLKRQLAKNEKASVNDVAELRYIAVDKDPESGSAFGRATRAHFGGICERGFRLDYILWWRVSGFQKADASSPS